MVVAVFVKVDESFFLIIADKIVIAFSKEKTTSYERLSLVNSVKHFIEKTTFRK